MCPNHRHVQSHMARLLCHTHETNMSVGLVLGAQVYTRHLPPGLHSHGVTCSLCCKNIQLQHRNTPLGHRQKAAGNFRSSSPGGRGVAQPTGFQQLPRVSDSIQATVQSQRPGVSGHGPLPALRKEQGALGPGLSPPPPLSTWLWVQFLHFLSHSRQGPGREERNSSRSAGLLTLPCSAYPGLVVPCPSPGRGVDEDESP